MAFLWQEGSIEGKEKLLKMLFPDGIYFDKNLSLYRTFQGNGVFELTRSILEDYYKNKNGVKADFSDYSVLVAESRFTSKFTEEINADFEAILDFNHFLKTVSPTTLS